jgi:hypothetical protein
MEEQEYTGLNPWHQAVHAGRGLSCDRCRHFFQGEEEWRRDILSYDPHRWYVMVADAARELGWKRCGPDTFLCPRCARKRKRRT